jgi:hypothetical protein
MVSPALATCLLLPSPLLPTMPRLWSLYHCHSAHTTITTNTTTITAAATPTTAATTSTTSWRSSIQSGSYRSRSGSRVVGVVVVVALVVAAGGSNDHRCYQCGMTPVLQLRPPRRSDFISDESCDHRCPTTRLLPLRWSVAAAVEVAAVVVATAVTAVMVAVV